MSCSTCLLAADQQAAGARQSGEFYHSLKIYTAVLSLVEGAYAEPVDVEQAIADSIQQMLRLLDPHSNFYDPEAFRELQEYQGGNYSGIGARVAPVEDQLMVLSTTPGSPASEAGMRPGDVISAVDGVSTRERPTSEVAALLRGPRGTAVEVLIERVGVKNPLQLRMHRDQIPEPSVPICYAIRPGVVYLKLLAFTATTEDEVTQALARFAPDIKGLVLDLRDNSGGNLGAAIAVTDRFLEVNEGILITKGRLPNANSEYLASRGRDELYPLTLLINQRTASAAEILAGAIQDNLRGLVVGESSFGKGLVQTVFPLSGGSGLSLTTARWFTPNGRMIQRDYKNRSLAEYLHLVESEGTSEPLVTSETFALGSPASSAGGITPDVLVGSPALTPFQHRLLSRHLVFAFARELKAKYPVLASAAVVSPSVLEEFRRYLRGRHVLHSDQEFQDNAVYVQRSLRSRLLLLSRQPEESSKVEIESDPQVIQALASLPQAKVLIKQNVAHVD